MKNYLRTGGVGERSCLESGSVNLLGYCSSRLATQPLQRHRRLWLSEGRASRAIFPERKLSTSKDDDEDDDEEKETWRSGAFVKLDLGNRAVSSIISKLSMEYSCRSEDK
jgi:hypothetical protein